MALQQISLSYLHVPLTVDSVIISKLWLGFDGIEDPTDSSLSTAQTVSIVS